MKMITSITIESKNHMHLLHSVFQAASQQMLIAPGGCSCSCSCGTIPPTPLTPSE